MRQTPIVRFLLHLLLLSIPLLVAVAVYVVLDPFKVVWHYDNYYERQAPHPSLDMDYVSCENYLARRDTCHYNAYLMGNSRSQFWPIADWQRHLPEGAVGYHYYGNGETLYRLNCHLRFLHEQQATIDHVLMVVDRDLLAETAQQTTGHLGLMPPKADGRLLAFHAENFLAFMKPAFLVGYIDFTLFGQLRPYMTENFLFEQPVDYDPVTNEVREYLLEEAIANDSYYTPERTRRFEGKQFPDSISPPVIGDEQRMLLKQMKDVLNLHHADCRIAISPLYDQIRLHPEDVAALRDIFGSANVNDFSGPNKWNDDYHLFYEDSHYRPVVARELMEMIYQR